VDHPADEAALRELWAAAVRRGDIPGAYWAVLSHPAATDALMRQAFGDVHMLSHMVGAANRADIRRLRQLEEDNAALAAKLERQQRQLRDGFTVRDDKIHLLNEALSRALAQSPAHSPGTAGHESDDLRVAKDALIDLDRRLSREVAHRKRLESRMEAATLAQSQAECARQDAAQECEDLSPRGRSPASSRLLATASCLSRHLRMKALRCFSISSGVFP
jgi:hypothetical protein